jgi:hypothetical protein
VDLRQAHQGERNVFYKRGLRVHLNAKPNRSDKSFQLNPDSCS